MKRYEVLLGAGIKPTLLRRISSGMEKGNLTSMAEFKDSLEAERVARLLNEAHPWEEA